MTHVVYRMYDRDSRSLYIGMSNDTMRRLGEHLTEKAWFGDVAHIAIEHFPDSSTAHAREVAAITAEKPLHNIRHRAARIKVARSGMTLVEAGERIGVSPHTLRRSAEAGTLHADKKGKTWLVTADELDRYARENKGKPGRKPKGGQG